MEYIEPLPTCDKILDLYNDKVAIEQNTIYNRLRGEQIKDDLIYAALAKLVSDKHLTPRNDNSFYNLGGDALIFIQQGKYLGLVERETKREEKELRNEELKEILDTHTLKVGNSVIDTNIIQSKNIKSTAKLFWVTFAIAVAGAIASWVQVINGNENKSLKDTIQKQDTLIESLQKQRLQIKNVPHLQITAKDSLNVNDSIKPH